MQIVSIFALDNDHSCIPIYISNQVLLQRAAPPKGRDEYKSVFIGGANILLCLQTSGQ